MTEPRSDASAEQKRRLTLAGKIGAGIKKVLLGYKLYKPGHSTQQGFIDALHEQFEDYLEQAEGLVYAITPSELMMQDVPVFSDDDRDHAIPKVLFLDGIRQLAFLRGLTAKELSTLLTIWFDFYAGKSVPGHTVTTRIWDAELDNVRVVSLHTFSEGSEEEEDDGAERGADELAALMERIGSERAHEPGTVAAHGQLVNVEARKVIGTVADVKQQIGSDQLVSVTADATRVLRMGALTELRGDDLRRQDVAERPPVKVLEPAERQRLTDTLAKDVDERVQRAVFDLTLLMARADSGERERLSEVLERIMLGARTAEQFRSVQRAFTRLAAVSTRDASYRAALEQLAMTLETPEVLESMISLLDQEAPREAATALLNRIRPDKAADLMAFLPDLETREARTELIRIIAGRTPDLTALKTGLQELGAELFAEMRNQLQDHGAGHSRVLLSAALAHADPHIRMGAVETVGQAGDESLHDLQPLIWDPDPEVRRKVVDLLVRARHEAAAPFLAQLAEQESIDGADRAFLINALGVLGGPEAMGLLRRRFETDGDIEVRVACARALGRAGDEEARPLLTRVARKWFGNRKLKRAAKLGLQFLDRRSPGTPTRSGASPEEDDQIDWRTGGDDG